MRSALGFLFVSCAVRCVPLFFVQSAVLPAVRSAISCAVCNAVGGGVSGAGGRAVSDSVSRAGSYVVSRALNHVGTVDPPQDDTQGPYVKPEVSRAKCKA